MTTHPLTVPESTGWTATSLHADVLAFLAALDARKDRRCVLTSFGASPEGRELPLVVLSKEGVSTPQEAHASQKPVVLVINGIHAGEVEGKESSQMILRDHLLGGAHQFLEDVVLVVVPLFNPDGNDRVDPKNRELNLAKLEGHIGPEKGVGTRVNAAGINLNRDYMAQHSLEMQLLQSRVCRPWQPHLTIDCHATNGSVHRFDMTYDVPHTIQSGRREPIEYMHDVALPEIRRRFAAATGRTSFFYGNFVEDEGGQGEGWMTYPHHPRFGSNFRGLTNRMDLLLETYSYLPFPERVATTHGFLLEALRYVAEHGRDVVQIVESSRMPPRRVAVRYRLEAFDQPVEILTRRPRALEGEPITVTLPRLARFVGTEVVERPWAYAVPEAAAQLLERHGLALERLEHDREAQVEVATIDAARSESSRKILEATSSGEREIEAHYASSTRKLRAGTALVRTEQPLGAIATYLCEARSDDGFVASNVLPTPQPGDEYPVWRVVEPLA